jgi:hypothetical protein
MFSVNGFYPPPSPLGKEGSPVLPLAKGELEGVSQGTLNTYGAERRPTTNLLITLAKRYKPCAAQINVATGSLRRPPDGFGFLCSNLTVLIRTPLFAPNQVTNAIAQEIFVFF